MQVFLDFLLNKRIRKKIMKNILWVLFISIFPIVELRVAIPVGAGLEVPFYWNYLAAVVGNLLPVPFILLFIPKILEFLRRFRIFRPIVDWLHRKAHKNRGKIDKSDINAEIVLDENGTPVANATKKERIGMSMGAFFGLMMFVLLPIPGTGAWTGSLVAALFDFPKRESFLAVLLGVLGCGVIMCLASYGVVGFLSFLNT